MSGIAAAFATLIGGLTVVPIGVLINRARRLLKVGFGHGDLDVAFRTELAQSHEERAVEGGHGPSVLERVLKGVSATGLGAAILAMLLGAGGDTIGATFVVFWGAGLGSLVLMQRRRDVDAEFWARVWMGRLGRWMFRMAKSFVPGRTLPAAMTHRPTELSIGMAAEQLFEGLPKATRQQLHDLPAVVHRLEEDAQRMRRRLEMLQDALGEPGAQSRAPGDGAIAERRDRMVAELRAERDLVQKRLADAVAALETIRLNLLRLHAGTGSVQRVTTDLGLAREVATELDLLLASQRELEADLD